MRGEEGETTQLRNDVQLHCSKNTTSAVIVFYDAGLRIFLTLGKLGNETLWAAVELCGVGDTSLINVPWY